MFTNAMQRRGRPKTCNQATVAWFQVWGVKWQCIVVEGGCRGGGGSYDATAVVGLHICRCKAEEKVGARKPEIDPPLLGFVSAVSNSSRGRWW